MGKETHQNEQGQKTRAPVERQRRRVSDQAGDEKKSVDREGGKRKREAHSRGREDENDRAPIGREGQEIGREKKDEEKVQDEDAASEGRRKD